MDSEIHKDSSSDLLSSTSSQGFIYRDELKNHLIQQSTTIELGWLYRIIVTIIEDYCNDYIGLL